MPYLDETLAVAESVQLRVTRGQYDTIDRNELADRLRDIGLRQGPATTTEDRVAQCITIAEYTQRAFSADAENLIDPSDHSELVILVNQMLTVAPDGYVQSRLNGDIGLVLCRYKVYRKMGGISFKQPARYMTRNPDLLEPFMKEMDKRFNSSVQRYRGYYEMLTNRVPELGAKRDEAALSAVYTVQRDLIRPGLRAAIQYPQGAPVPALNGPTDDDDAEDEN